MLRNYLKTAWRNLARNKFYSLINIMGLSVGLACLILIMLFVTDELSYDNFHDRSDDIHLVGREAKFGRKVSKGLSTPYPLGPTMKEEIPEVEHYVVAMWPGPGRVSIEGQDPVREDKIMMTTEDFFEVFSFPLVSGNPETVLQDPNAVVLTERIAEKYFPGENPIGETIRIQRYGDREYTVTGIAKNTDRNSYVSFDIITSILGTSSVEINRESWTASMFHTYVKLQEGAEWEQVKPKLAEIVDTQLDNKTETTFFSIPISQLYISDLVKVTGFRGDMKYIYIFSAIAFFILLLACINYMNLSTARATQRTKEVGVRKVVGARRGQLIGQFLGESVILTIAASFLAFIMAEFTLPIFNAFVGKELTLNIAENATFLSSLLGVVLLVGLLSGSYPAFFLSRFKPSGILKGKGNDKYLSGATLRKILVTAQFAISTVLIICTILAFNQLRYVMEKDLGFEGDQVMYIPAYSLQDKIETFEQAVESHSAVQFASTSDGVPGSFSYRISRSFDPLNPQNEFSVHRLRSDADYDDVLGLELVAGRYFDEKRITDQKDARVINEAMVKELGWDSAEKSVGRELDGGSRVIGVVKNFHFQSLHKEIGPVYILPSSSENHDMVSLRFNPEQVSDLINFLEKKWQDLAPSSSMSYYFLDEQFAELYETDQKLSQAFSVFAGIAIFIACMGLLGLATFSAERRTKEIGVRKVLGATVGDIIGLLSKDFLKLVLAGFVVAIPISWYAMNQWLADFAYRIEIGAGVFILSGLAAIFIALITVSWQSVRAATANPVDSLRSE